MGLNFPAQLSSVVILVLRSEWLCLPPWSLRLSVITSGPQEMKTGDIEVVAHDITVLNKPERELPFNIRSFNKASAQRRPRREHRSDAVGEFSRNELTSIRSTYCCLAGYGKCKTLW